VRLATRIIATGMGLAIVATGCSTSASDTTDVGQGPSVASVSAEQRATIEAQMTSLRVNDGNTVGNTEPLRDVNGAKITTLAPYPGLLAAARDSGGLSQYESSTPDNDLAADDVALIGSTTKTFTAAAILQLDQEGKLSVSDTLADPKWADVIAWPNGQNITLEMVLSHTAGIPEFTATKGFQKGIDSPDWNPTPNELLGFARNKPTLFPPGQAWVYSNTDYIILGLIIEQVTGNSYADELKTRFFDPLGLSQTYLFGDPKTDPSMTGFFLQCQDAAPDTGSSNGGKPPTCESGVGSWSPMTEPYTNSWPIIWAAGSIASSTSDLTTWMTELISTDNVLDAEHRALMRKPVPQSKAGIKKQFPQFEPYFTGYGLGMGTFEYDIGPALGHPGNIQGFAGQTVYFPGEGNDFAMNLVAGQTHANVAAQGGNAMASTIKANRG